MIAHHTRTHAAWAASATARNIVCAGAIAMETMCEDKETEAAAWGTAAHQIAERCLKSTANAIDFLGDVEKSGKFEFVIDEEMANCSQVYVDYCRGRLAEYEEKTGEKAQVWIEQKLSLAALNTPIDAGGTGDCVMYFPRWRLLEIVDLKGGRGVVVSVKNNPQEMTYAVGAMLTFPHLIVDYIRATIVQPRVGDGKPQHHDFLVADLVDWTIDLLARMKLSHSALDEFEALGGSRVKFDEWAEKWLQTGACTFCPAEGICPKRRKEALSVIGDTARKWFEEPAGETPLIVGNAPDIASPEDLAHWLDGLEALEAWIKSLRGYAHSAAERGVTIPGYMLADKIGNRAYIEKDETKLAAMLGNKLGLTVDQIYERSIRSVAQIEKMLGAKRKAELTALEKVLWEKPVKGTNLVRADKTTRPAAKGLTERHHEEL
jgi:hypothetical protein